MTTRFGRITAAIVAIAAMLPYLTLKIIWMTGHPVGVSDAAWLASPTMTAMNAMTFGMDVVALILALAFSMRWGMRLPAWLVLLPIWVGTGLLGHIVATVPLSMALEGPSVFPADGPIAGWIYAIVYAGFIGQGIGLMAAFVLYARDRWPSVFTTPIAHGTANPFQVVIARGVVLVAGTIGTIKLYWAFGGTWGLDPQIVAGASLSGSVQQGFKGLFAWAAALAFLVMARGRSRRPFWQPLVVAWLGAGSMFGWGLYAMIVTLSAAFGDPVATVIPDLVELFAMLTGLVMGLAGAFLLLERSGRRVVQAPQDALEGHQREGDREPADSGHR